MSVSDSTVAAAAAAATTDMDLGVSCGSSVVSSDSGFVVNNNDDDDDDDKSMSDSSSCSSSEEESTENEEEEENEYEQVDESILHFLHTSVRESEYKTKFNHENETLKTFRSNFGQICCFRRGDLTAILSKGIQAQYNAGGKFDLHDYSAVIIQDAYIPREWQPQNKLYQVGKYFKETYATKDTLPAITRVLKQQTPEIYKMEIKKSTISQKCLINDDLLSEQWFERQCKEFERVMPPPSLSRNVEKLLNMCKKAEKLDMYETWNLRKNHFDRINMCGKFLWQLYCQCIQHITMNKNCCQLEDFFLDNYGGGLLDMFCHRADSNLSPSRSKFSLGSFSSSTSLQVNSGLYTTIDYLYGGHGRLWLIIPPQENGKLFKAFQEECKKYNINFSTCSMPLRHPFFFLMPDFLQKYNIKVELFMQNPGTAVIIKDNVYYQVINFGINLSESMNFGSNLRMIADNLIDYCNCGNDNNLQIKISPAAKCLPYKIVVNRKRTKSYCKYCKRTWDMKKNGYTLKEHIEKSHLQEKEKKYKCQYCSVKFLDMNSKLLHEKNHILREGNCYICRPYKYFVRLQKHLKEVHHISILNKYIGNPVWKDKFRVKFSSLTSSSTEETDLEHVFREIATGIPALI
nr:hypothetical protein [Microctonus hyperodae filamentous virus]